MLGNKVKIRATQLHAHLKEATLASLGCSTRAWARETLREEPSAPQRRYLQLGAWCFLTFSTASETSFAEPAATTAVTTSSALSPGDRAPSTTLLTKSAIPREKSEKVDAGIGVWGLSGAKKKTQFYQEGSKECFGVPVYPV